MLARIIPLRRLPLRLSVLDYAVPSSMISEIKPGHIVEVFLGKSITCGVVSELLPEATSTFKIKPIERLVSPPIFNHNVLSFFTEVSTLYRVSLGFLFKNSLPVLNKKTLAALREIKIDKSPDSKHVALASTYFTTKNERDLFFRKLFSESFGQTLIIVPEQTDIAELLSDSDEETRKHIVAVSSETTAVAYRKAWLDVLQNKHAVIIGTRRAFFLPFCNLQNIVLYDESNPVHKSWDMAPRFDARDIVQLLGEIYKIKPTFTGFTQSVAEFAHEPTKLAPIACDVVNMLDERKSGNFSLVSADLKAALEKSAAGVSFCFLNRRGSLHYMGCSDCGFVFKCQNCSSNLTFFESKSVFVCLTCGVTKPAEFTCPKCHNILRKTIGSGTEQFTKDLKKILAPDRIVYTIDSDNETVELSYKPGTVIVGTSFAWNKLAWEKLSCFAFIDPDQSLLIPEYRSAEDLWHLVRDAYFNLPKESQLILQTRHPEHVLYRSLYAPATFYEAELAQRRAFGYPPYSTLIKLFIGKETRAETEQNARNLYGALKTLTVSDAQITIVPPRETVPGFHRGAYYSYILAKINRPFSVNEIRKVLDKVPLDWQIDINPASIASL